MEDDMELSSGKQTSDGGFMFLAGTRWYTELIKTDKEGIIQWKKSFGGNYIDLASSGQQTKDGGYVIAGSSWRILIFHVLDISNGWLIKTDDKGNEMWNKNLRKSFLSSAVYSGQQTSDGGYIFAGTTGTYGLRSYDAWLIKLKGDTNGSLNNHSVRLVDDKKNSSTKSDGFDKQKPAPSSGFHIAILSIIILFLLKRRI